MVVFNHEIGLKLCRLAELVYDDEAAARAAGGEMGLALVKWSWRGQGATRAGLWKDKRNVYLTFCGTNDWVDLLDHISIVPLPHRWGRIHGGFRSALKRVEDEVVEAVMRLMGAGDRALWITGHSLGGALAMLMAARFHFEKIDIAGLYTFGQPKTGDEDFKRHYDAALGDRTWRVVHRNDPVPDFMRMLFRHAGIFYGLGKKSRRRIKHPGRKGTHRYGQTRVSSIPDHTIAKYHAELAKDAADPVAFRRSYEKVCDMLDAVRRDQYVSFIQ